MITHLSILVVFAGALVGSLGFVGTVNIYEGDWSDRCYDWERGADRGLGFSLQVEKLTLEYYPVRMKIKVRGRASGMEIGTFDTREGGKLRVPGSDIAVVPQGLDFTRHEALLNVYSGGRLLGEYDTGLPEGGPLSPPHLEYAFDLDSYGGRQAKSIASTVGIVKGGRLVKHGVVEVNSPLKYDGMSIYQTAYSADADGRYYSGFQIVRDPGIPLVWGGFILLLAGLFFSFYFYHRQVWIFIGDDRITIGGTTNKDMQSFMREYTGIIKTFMQEVEP
jgi:cytochrome c biogenesis protein